MGKAVFLDTMIWLHFKPVAQIDWPSVTGSDRITLVVPRITIRELDRHKDSHRSSTIRERARRTLVLLENWLRQGPSEIRPNVVLEYFPDVPDVTAAPIPLDPSWNDDVLIASILQYRAKNNSEVLLVTQDAGPSLTAHGVGVPVLKLPDVYQLPVEPDPAEKELQELRRQLARLQSAQPRLLLSFGGAEQATVMKVVLRPEVPAPQERIEASVREMETKYPPMARSNSVFGTAFVPSDGEYDRYNRERREYFANHRAFLEQSWQHKTFLDRLTRLDLVLANAGTAVAEDVDLDLHIPDGPEVLSEEELPEPPHSPEPPRKPMTIGEMTNAIARPLLPNYNLGPSAPAISNVSTPRISRGSSYDVHYHVRRLKHGLRESLPPIFFYFKDNAPGSFGIEYTIRVANVMEATKGRLNIVVGDSA